MVQTQIKIAVEVILKKEVQFPTELCFVESKMSTDGIGSQSRFCGDLNFDYQPERVPISFEYSRQRTSLQPILKTNITNVFNQHTSHLDVRARIVGKREPC